MYMILLFATEAGVTLIDVYWITYVFHIDIIQ